MTFLNVFCIHVKKFVSARSLLHKSLTQIRAKIHLFNKQNWLKKGVKKFDILCKTHLYFASKPKFYYSFFWEFELALKLIREFFFFHCAKIHTNKGLQTLELSQKNLGPKFCRETNKYIILFLLIIFSDVSYSFSTQLHHIGESQ